MKIGVAADITAVENLFLTVGVTIPTFFDGYTATVKTAASASATDVDIFGNPWLPVT